MNKDTSTKSYCPADKAVAPSCGGVKTAATICYRLLGTLCISLLLCVASSSVHGMMKKYETESHDPSKTIKAKTFTIKNASFLLKEQKTIYYVYDPDADPELHVSPIDGFKKKWRFVYSPKFVAYGSLDWNKATPFGEISDFLDFEAFFQVAHAPGYYLFRTSGSGNFSDNAPIQIPGIHDFTASLRRSRITKNQPGKIVLTTDVVGSSKAVIYQIEDYESGSFAVYSEGKQIHVQHNGIFRIPASGKPHKIVVQTTKAGVTEIHANYGISKKSVQLFLESEGKSFLILKNANDSNNDHEADCKSQAETANNDPELFKLDILASESVRPLEKLDIGNSVELTLKVPAAFHIYSSARKTAFGPASAMEGYHLVYHWHLTPENLNSILQTLDNVYLEGVIPSGAPGDYEITFEIKQGGQSSTVQWTATILDLFINRSIPPAYYILRSGFLVPRVKNPAVISHVYITPESDPLEIEQLSSIFEVQSSNMAMLQYVRDHIEWIYPANLVKPIPGQSRFGASIKLYALGDGDVKIGVRLRGSETDYLQINAPALSTKPIPVFFQLLAPDYETNLTTKRQYGKMIKVIPDLLHCMNFIARQSGIYFHAIDSTNASNRSGFLDKLSFIVEPEDPNLFPPTWTSATPPILPRNTKNQYTIFGQSNIWTGSIWGFWQNIQTERFHIANSALPKLPIQYPATIVPDINMPGLISYALDNGVLLHSNAPDWITNEAWPYAMAISSANNAVSFNFLPVGDFGNGKTGAITGLLSPSPQAVPVGTGFVSLSYVNHFHLFQIPYGPGEPSHGYACVALSLPDYDEKSRTAFIPNYARQLIPAALRTLGLKERSLMGELDAYKDPELLNTALEQKILLYRDGQLIINPVTPLTAHEDAVINPYDDILSRNPQQQYGYRIDEYRTSLLRQHPFTQPQNP